MGVLRSFCEAFWGVRRGGIQGLQLGKNIQSNREKKNKKWEKEESEMLGDPAEGGPPCWMLVGDVGCVLVGSWLFVGWWL